MFFFVFFFKEKDEDGNEIKQKSSNTTASKKKKKEIDLPITPRVPGASRKELDRLIEQEVKYISLIFFSIISLFCF